MVNEGSRIERSGTLTLQVQASQDALVLELAGELDLACAGLLETEIKAAEASGPGRIVVDLSPLEFIDSRGLEVLVRAHERAGGDLDRFEIRGANGAVAQVLEVTGLVGFLG